MVPTRAASIDGDEAILVPVNPLPGTLWYGLLLPVPGSPVPVLQVLLLLVPVPGSPVPVPVPVLVRAPRDPARTWVYRRVLTLTIPDRGTPICATSVWIRSSSSRT